MLQLKCTGLNLTSLNALSCAEGSIDVPVTIEFDSTYNGYTKSLSVGYYNENGIEQNVSVSQENEQFMIPGPVFAQSGIIFISVHFQKEGVKFEPETNAVNYFVTKTAGGSGNLGARYTWEPVVKSFVDQYLTNNPPTVVTDLTLTKSGQAADAKVVGEKFSKLSEDKVDIATVLKNIMTMFRASDIAYTSDISHLANQNDELIEKLGAVEEDEPIIPDEPDNPDVTKYTITNLFTNVTSNNSKSSVQENSSYTATLTASDGYVLNSILVIMGGVDITTSVVSNGVITIPSVTANVEITAIAVQEEVEANLIEDGLVAYFDMRNIDIASVNTASLPGDGYGLPTATKGSASLYSWGAWCTDTDEYGTTISRGLTLGNENTTTGKTFNGDYTFFGLGKGVGYVNNGIGTVNNIHVNPKYKNTSGSEVNVGSTKVHTPSGDTYRLFIQRVSNSNLDIFVDETKVYTFDGTQYDGFASWVISNGVSVNPYAGNSKITAFAFYDRALTDVEITELYAYFKTLEVSA